MIDGYEAAEGEVLVKMRAGVAATGRRQLEQQIDAESSEPVGRTLRRVRSRSFDAATLLAFLETHPDVEYAEPNYVLHATATPNDFYFPFYLWGLHNTGQNILGTVGIAGADIHATQAWDITTGSRANVVAVIDTGIGYTHPDLALNVWSAPSAFQVNIGGTVITCAAGTHGFNAITKTCDPMDDNNHGSHVSGTIGAVGNNGQGVVGVNWTASIMGSKFLDSTGSGYISDAVNAIDFVIQAKAAFAATSGANVRVLSNSWGGGGFSQAFLDEMNLANANDMLFVAAAGNYSSNNDFYPFYPARYGTPNEIVVAATDNTDRLAYFSDYGYSVDLAAPGVSVLSTTIVGGAGYQFYDGTSMATPHVSGAAALVLSACPASTANLKSALVNSVDVIAGLGGYVGTSGRLNVYRALQSCLNPQPPTISVPSTGSVFENSRAGIPVNIADPDTLPQYLTLSAVSSNQTVLPNAGITFSGSSNSAFRTMTVVPATNQFGTTTVTTTVSDGVRTASATTLVTVIHIDQPPTMSAVANQIVIESTSSSAIPITVADVDDPVSNLTFTTPGSSNPTLLPATNIVFGGSGANRTMTLTPATGQTGSATVTIRLSDGTTQTSQRFLLNVVPTNSIVFDTFTEPNGTQAPSHTPDLNLTGNGWTVTGGPPTPSIASGRLYSAAGAGHMQTTIDAGISDIDLATDYIVGSGPGMGGLAFRETDTNNLLLLVTNQNVLQLYTRQGGMWNLLASQPIAALTVGSTHRLEVHAVGSSVQGLWDHAVVIQATTTVQQTATRHGLDWNTAYDATSSYDNVVIVDARPIVATVSVTPSTPLVYSGSSIPVSALARDATNAPINGVAFTWSTGDSTIATVASTGVGTATVTGVAPGTTTLTATAPNGVHSTVNVTVEAPPVLASVTVTPAPVTMTAFGHQSVSALAKDQYNSPMTGQAFTWSTADTTIATVASNGASAATVTGVAAGTTTLTATASNGVTGTVTVTVSHAPETWLVSDTFTDANGTLLTAHTPDLNQTGQPWTVTGGPPTPTISNGRAVTTGGPGHMQLTIDAGISDIDLATDYIVGSGPGMGGLAFRETDANNLLALITNQNVLQLYARQNGNWSLLGAQAIGALVPGSTHRLQVRAVGSNVQAMWDSNVVFTVATTVQQTATRHGLDWNTAYDTTSAYDNVFLQNAGPTVASVRMSPLSFAMFAGGIEGVDAIGYDATNGPIAGVAFTWSTGNSNVATVVSTSACCSTVTGVAPGTTTLTATAPNGVTGTINVTVQTPPTVASVQVQPASISVSWVGNKVVFADLKDASGNVIAGFPVTWQIADTSIARIVPSDITTATVYGVAAGTTTLTATAQNGVSQTVPVTVTGVPLTWLVSDTFTDTNGTLLTVHTPDINQTGNVWTVTGGPPTPTISNGRAVTTAGGGHMQLTIDAGISDIDLATDYIVGSGPGMGGLAFRETDGNNLLALITNQNVLQLYARQNGNWSLLGSQAINALMPGSTHRLQVHAVGSSVQAMWDNNVVFTVTTSVQQAGTKHGLDWNTAYDTTSAYDNLFLQDARPTVTTVNVTPSPVSVFAGSTQSATARAVDATSAPINGVVFAWSTGDATIATVASTGAGTATVTGVAPGTTTLTATAPNGVVGTVTINVQSPPTVTSVSVMPASVSVSSFSSQPVSAQAFDANNSPMSGITFTWHVADTTIATVASTGAGTASVTGVAAGSTTLTATAPNGVSQTVPVTVTGVPASWLVSDSFTDTNGTLLTAHAPDINQTGNAWTVTGGPPTPTIGNGRAVTAAGGGHMQLTIDTGIADVDLATDYIVGSGPGMGGLAFRETDGNNLLALLTYLNTLQLYARQNGNWGMLASQPIGTLMPGSTHRLEVRAVGSNVQAMWDGSVVFTVTTTVQQTGTRHGLDWNTSYDATSAYDNLFLQDARPTVTTANISPSPVNVTLGGSQPVTAQALDATNAPITGVAFTWGSGNSAIATVASTGAGTATVTAVATGTTTLTATAPNGVSATVTVNVTTQPTGLLVSDTFTDTNGTLLTSHTPDTNQTGHAWTVTGGPPTPTISGGRAVTAAGGGHMQVTIDAGIADVKVATDYVAGSGPGMGVLIFRATDVNNLLALVTNQSTVQLYARQGGAWTLLAGASISAINPGSTHHLEVRAVGSSIQGFWDGQQVLQSTTTLQQTATRHGLDWNTAYDASSAYDNFTLSSWP